MNYNLIKDVVGLIEQFEMEFKHSFHSENSIENFKRWIAINFHNENVNNETYWKGKEKGRSAESVINTLLVRMNRYAKNYSKSAILGSDFSSQEDFIYLINLKTFGEMTKIDLIKKNVHEKPVGIKIINRLIAKGLVNQTDSEINKRSKILKITPRGIDVLESQMDNIRKASKIVAGDLTHNEKMELILLLHKLDDFHKPIYEKNIEPKYLLKNAFSKIKQ